MNNNNSVEINIIKSDNNITINIQKAQSKNIDGMNFQNGESVLFNKRTISKMKKKKKKNSVMILFLVMIKIILTLKIMNKMI